jgi:hypothetical protein
LKTRKTFVDVEPRHLGCRASRARQRGSTLAKYVVSVGVSAILVIAVCAFALFNGRSFAVYSALADLDLANRKTLNQMSKDFRMALSLTNYSDESITLVDYDGLPVNYTYDATGKTLTRTKESKSSVLLKDCTSLNFYMNTRNMSNGTFLFFPATNVCECKAITVDWACSRKYLGILTEDMPQTATIVIRN